MELLRGGAATGRKVQNYDALALSGWRALFTLSHTVILDSSTYSLLLFLAFLSIASFVVINVTGLDRSVEDDGLVSARLMYLLSFILAGHVTIAINRWYQIRHQIFGPLWGALENLFLLACQLAPDKVALQETVLRQARLTMRLVFAAAQGVDCLADLQCDGLAMAEECAILDQLLVGSRPFTSAMWISRALEEEHCAALESKKLSPLMQQTFSFTLQQNVLQLKSGIGGTLGYVGCPIPFLFVHLVNWTVVFSLFTLSVSTGVILAIGWRRRETGNNQYTGDRAWPHSPQSWFINFALTYSIQTFLYGIFSLGLVRICAKMHNPLSAEDCSFPETSYDTFLHNNCRALQVGVTSSLHTVAVLPAASVAAAAPATLPAATKARLPFEMGP